MRVLREILCLCTAFFGLVRMSADCHAQQDRGERAGTAIPGKKADASAEIAAGQDEEGAAERERQRADDVARRYDWLEYGRHIFEAHHAWEAGAVADAWRHLNACRYDLRGWEHDYLFSLFTKDHRVMKTRGGVGCVAYSADGRRLVSGYAFVVSAWDPATGRELLNHSPQMSTSSVIAAVTFTPDGKRILLGAQGQGVEVLDAESGKVLLTRGEGGDHLGISADGQRIVSSRTIGTPVLWDASTGKDIRAFPQLKGWVRSLAIGPDGKRIACSGDDKLIRIVDPATGTVAHTFKGHREIVESVVFSPNGRRLASGGSDKTIRLWDVSTGKELFSLTGHAERIVSLAFSPDGLTLASGSDDGLVKLWDVATVRRELRSFKGHAARVTSVAFSPDGKQIASGSSDETIRIWDVASADHDLIPILERSAPDFGSDDEPKLSGITERIRMWDFSTGKPRETQGESGSTQQPAAKPRGTGAGGRNPAPPAGLVESDVASSGTVLRALSETGQTFDTFRPHAYAYSPDGKQVVVTGGESISGMHGGYLKLRDIATGQVVHTFSERGPFHHAVFSPDGKWVAGSTFQRIEIWDAASGRSIRTMDGMARFAMDRVEMITSLAVNSDGARLAAGSSDGTVQVLEVSSGRLLASLKGHVQVDSVAFSPDGQRIVSTGKDGIRICEVTSGQELLMLRRRSDTSSQTVFTPDGKCLVSKDRFASKDSAGRLEFRNARSKQRVFTLVEYGEPMALSPDGRRLTCRGPDGAMQLVDRVSGRAILTFAGDSSDCYCVAFSPDGKQVVGGAKDGGLNLWEAESGRLIREPKGHTHYVGSVAFSPDGKRIVSGSGDRSIIIWDAASGEASRMIDGHWASCVAFSPDGKRIAAANRDAPIRLWDVATGEEVQKIGEKTAGYECFAFSPDGRRIASGSHDEIVRVWDAETGRQVLAMKGHSSFVYGVAFSPNGKWLASASWDHTAKVWDLATGMEYRALRQHSSYCSSVAFTPDSRWLLTGSGELKLWDLSGTQAELIE